MREPKSVPESQSPQVSAISNAPTSPTESPNGSVLVGKIIESPGELGWKIYKNESLGFEIKFPSGFTVSEVDDQPFGPGDPYPERRFRYVFFKGLLKNAEAGNDDSRMNFSIGIKGVGEKDVEPRVWRTGVPAGEFQKTRVSINGRPVDRWDLVYESSVMEQALLKGQSSEDESKIQQVQLVWFCAPDRDVRKWCDEFPLSDTKKAFIEVSGDWVLGSPEWKDLQEMLSMITSSIKIIP